MLGKQYIGPVERTNTERCRTQVYSSVRVLYLPGGTPTKLGTGRSPVVSEGLIKRARFPISELAVHPVGVASPSDEPLELASSQRSFLVFSRADLSYSPKTVGGTAERVPTSCSLADVARVAPIFNVAQGLRVVEGFLLLSGNAGQSAAERPPWKPHRPPVGHLITHQIAL
jgi:hypothetical protein